MSHLMSPVLLVALALGFAAPALAQNDPATRLLIDRLGAQSRGLRLPAQEAPTQSPAPAAPAAVAPVAPPASSSTPPPPAQREAAVGAIRTQTTAPAGVPAVSLTVTFASGSAKLTPQAEAALAPLGRALNAPELMPFRFRIEGHTDTVGSHELNMDLSRRRAEAVRDFLVQRYGVPAARLEAVGLGKTQLLVATPDETPEQRNRRVQVLNLGG